MWIKIKEQSRGIDYEIEIRTTNGYSHSILSKDPTIWNKIISAVRIELQTAIKERENK